MVKYRQGIWGALSVLMCAWVRNRKVQYKLSVPGADRKDEAFAWRKEDAHRNSLNAHCYWMLRKKGMDVREATAQIEGKSVSWKNELLFSEHINYNDLPCWQKRGVGLYYSTYEKKGYDPVKEEEVWAVRNRLETELELKTGEEYQEWVVSLLERK